MTACEQEHPGYDCGGTCAVAKFGSTRPVSTQADRLTKLTSQLVGDISRLEGVSLSPAGEAQLVQLLTDAFEGVGHLALDGQQRCPLADCALDYPHMHQNLLQVSAHPGDIVS